MLEPTLMRAFSLLSDQFVYVLSDGRTNKELKCTCKPGSVSTGITHVNGDHLSKNAVTRILQRPTRESKRTGQFVS